MSIIQQFETYKVADGSLTAQGEMEMLADDSGRVLVVWMDGSPALQHTVTFASATSHDGGRTFTSPQKVDSDLILLDPTLCQDERGNVYLAGLRKDSEDSYKDLSVVLYRSTDFGMTWSSPAFVINDDKDFDDRPWITAEAGGRLHFVYGRRVQLNDGNFSRPIYYQQSAGGGRNFVAKLLVNPSHTLPPDCAGGSPRGVAVTMDGRVVVGFQLIPRKNKVRHGAGTFPGAGGVIISHDGGKSFRPPVLFTTPATIIADGSDDEFNLAESKNIKPFPRIKSFRNNIYAIWVGEARGDNHSIYVAAYLDGSGGFNQPLALATAPLNSLILSTLAIDLDGKLHAFWFGRRTDDLWTLYYSRSSNDGETFTPPREVTDIAFTLNNWPGDFINAVTNDEDLFVPWVSVGGSEKGIYVTIARGVTN
jgi:hypothetical protein